jgi:hypothetical protein
MLARVYEESLVAFWQQRSTRITAVEDAAATRSYEILIDGERPTDSSGDQDLEYNTEKAIERYLQLGTYWEAYHDSA